MGQKVRDELELEAIQLACDVIKKYETDVTDAIPGAKEEDYTVKDATLYISGTTVPMEVKRYKGKILNDDGTLNGEFMSTTSGRILYNIAYIDLTGQMKHGVPENYSGKCVYMINDNFKHPNYPTKWMNLTREKAWLAIVASDAVAYFKGYDELMGALVGEAYYWSDPTWRDRDWRDKHWERKRLLDMSKAHVCQTTRHHFFK